MTTQAPTKRLFLQAGKIGVRIEGQTLTRKAQSSKHLWRRPPAWSFHTALLETAASLGVQTVCVHDVETDTRYFAPLSAFQTHGFRLHCEGYGEQTALPLRYWTREDPTQPTLF